MDPLKAIQTTLQLWPFDNPTCHPGRLYSNTFGEFETIRPTIFRDSAYQRYTQDEACKAWINFAKQKQVDTHWEGDQVGYELNVDPKPCFTGFSQ